MFDSRKLTALVPIKDHSERISGKNFREFCGKPLYHHIIETLHRSYPVDEILIDTDSERVHHEAPRISHKVRTIQRPPELQGDEISVNKLIEYDLTLTDSGLFIQTHATNPLLKPQTITESLKEFVQHEGDNDSLFSVTTYQSRFYHGDGSAINHDPQTLLRTQDLDPIYEENSVLYIFTRQAFDKTSRRIGETPFLFRTPDVESIDIDNAFSLHIAQLLAMYSLDKQ